jgi:hypothetical protein
MAVAGQGSDAEFPYSAEYRVGLVAAGIKGSWWSGDAAAGASDNRLEAIGDESRLAVAVGAVE